MDSTGTLLKSSLVGSSFRSPAPHLESIPVWKPLQPQREQRWTLSCLWGLGWLVASGPAGKSLPHTPAAPGPGSLPDTSSHTAAPTLPWGLHPPPHLPSPCKVLAASLERGPSGSQDKQTVAVAQPSAGARSPPLLPQCTAALPLCSAANLAAVSAVTINTSEGKERELSSL